MDRKAGAHETAKPSKPLYGRRGGSAAASQSSSWFEIRLFYVRISPCDPHSVPLLLTLSHLRRDMGVALEINGSRIPTSELTSLVLRRDRLDCSAGEVTYLCTDDVRLTGAVEFEVCDRDGNLVLCGSLEKMEAPWINGTIRFEGHRELCDQDPGTRWSMNCYSAAAIASSAFLQPKLGISSPQIEVYVAGCFSGYPLILTQTIQLSPRKKVSRPGALDAIPEEEETIRTLKRCTEDKEGIDEYNREMIAIQNSHHYPECWDSEVDGQLSWFNAGVRVGVGVGLGMSVGIGIGMGLLMRSYQATSRSFKRRFFF